MPWRVALLLLPMAAGHRLALLAGHQQLEAADPLEDHKLLLEIFQSPDPACGYCPQHICLCGQCSESPSLPALHPSFPSAFLPSGLFLEGWVPSGLLLCGTDAEEGTKCYILERPGGTWNDYPTLNTYQHFHLLPGYEEDANRGYEAVAIGTMNLKQETLVLENSIWHEGPKLVEEAGQQCTVKVNLGTTSFYLILGGQEEAHPGTGGGCQFEA